MTLPIRLNAGAHRDVAAAKEWYAAQDVPDLDLRFQQELEQALETIESFPTGFPSVHKDIRRANLNRFPYGVFYHQRDDQLYVLGVVHHARHPRTWQTLGSWKSR